MFTNANVTVMVSDIDRALQVYVDKLGLELRSRYADKFTEVQASERSDNRSASGHAAWPKTRKFGEHFHRPGGRQSGAGRE